MDSQIDHPHGRTYGDDPHNVGLHSVLEGEGVDQQHHEKKSVLKKVKAKAKKIKDTLAKRSPGHGQEHHDDDEYHQEDDGDDDYDEVDEDMVENPEPHGAPMSAPSPGTNQTRVNDVTRKFDHGKEGNQGQIGGYLGSSTALEEDPHAPKNGPEAYNPANYQTKVSDPTGAGGEEARITPILTSFGKMSVSDEPKSKSHQTPPIDQHRLPTGTHDQFSPELSPPTKTDSDQPHDTTTNDSPKNQSSSYTQKLSFATSAIADKAISAKNVVASKLGYGGKPDNVVTEFRESGETETAKSPSHVGESGETETTKSPSHVGESGETETTKSPSQVGGYGKKITSTVTEKLAPVFGKVAGAGTTVMSKVTGSGTGCETEDVGGKGPTEKGESVKQYWAERLKPGEEDKALSEAILDVLHKRKEEEGTEHKEGKPMGKVAELEDVAKRLGTGDDYSGGERVDSGDVKVNAAGDANKGMVNTVKGAVSSWFGKGEVGHGNEGSGERRLQESSN